MTSRNFPASQHAYKSSWIWVDWAELATSQKEKEDIFSQSCIKKYQDVPDLHVLMFLTRPRPPTDESQDFRAKIISSEVYFT